MVASVSSLSVIQNSSHELDKKLTETTQYPIFINEESCIDCRGSITKSLTRLKYINGCCSYIHKECVQSFVKGWGLSCPTHRNNNTACRLAFIENLTFPEQYLGLIDFSTREELVKNPQQSFFNAAKEGNVIHLSFLSLHPDVNPLLENVDGKSAAQLALENNHLWINHYLNKMDIQAMDYLTHLRFLNQQISEGNLAARADGLPNECELVRKISEENLLFEKAEGKRRLTLAPTH